MPQPAACITFPQACPLVDVTIPHVGGPIIGPGAPTVLIEGIPAACVGDTCSCIGPPATISAGSPTVLHDGRMAARLGDPTNHGGVITLGVPTVIIGP